MTKEELKEYLSEHLKIEIDKDFGYDDGPDEITVKLKLEEEVISTAYFTIYK